MLIDDYTITPLNATQCRLSWESEAETTVSWLFLNGRFYLGPFMAETKTRSMEIPFSGRKTLVVEIHDFPDLDTIPISAEEKPITRPGIAWNAVSEAKKYRLYHRPFGGGERKVEEYPNRPVERIEVDCPVSLEGRNGKWHGFRVESLDRFGRESESGGEMMQVFAADLPPVANVEIIRNGDSTLTFKIGA